MDSKRQNKDIRKSVQSYVHEFFEKELEKKKKKYLGKKLLKFA